MEKRIAASSYWMGIVFLVVAILWRAVAFATGTLPVIISGHSIGYLTFYRASLLFFAMTVASAAHAWVDSRPQ